MRYSRAFLVLLASAFLLADSFISAQFNPQQPVRPPGPPGGQYPTYAGRQPPPPSYPPGYPSPVAQPGGYYPAVPAYGYNGRYGGAMTGMANLVSAQGQYQIDNQQAQLMSQDVERSRMDTRKMFLQQQQYERSLEPTAPELIEQQRQLRLRTAMNDPPLPIITSGEALNVLMKDIRAKQIRGAGAPPVPIDQSMLSQVNVAGSAGGNIALFKDGGKLKWPFAMQEKSYDESRATFEKAVQDAMMQVQAGGLKADTYRTMNSTIDALQATVDRNARAASLSDTIAAQRYMDELKDGVQALQDPSATNYFTKKWTAQGQDVSQLVQYMTVQGLTFAPALPGEESAYRSVHFSMVAYNTAIDQQSARR